MSTSASGTSSCAGADGSSRCALTGAGMRGSQPPDASSSYHPLPPAPRQLRVLREHVSAPGTRRATFSHALVWPLKLGLRTPALRCGHLSGLSRTRGGFFNFEVGGHDGASKGRLHVIVPFVGRNIVIHCKHCDRWPEHSFGCRARRANVPSHRGSPSCVRMNMCMCEHVHMPHWRRR